MKFKFTKIAISVLALNMTITIDQVNDARFIEDDPDFIEVIDGLASGWHWGLNKSHAYDTEHIDVRGSRPPEYDWPPVDPYEPPNYDDYGDGGGGGGGGDYTETPEKDPNEKLSKAEVANLTAQLLQFKNALNNFLTTNDKYLSEIQRDKIKAMAAGIDKVLGWVGNTATITGIMLEQKYSELPPEVAAMLAGAVTGTVLVAAGANPLAVFGATVVSSELTKRFVANAQAYIVSYVGPIVRDYNSVPDRDRLCDFSGIPRTFCNKQMP